MNSTQNRLRRDFETISILVRSKLWLQILLAMCSGLFIGILLSAEGGAAVSSETSLIIASWLKLPGTIFLNLIQMVVIPLIMSSIITGISSSGSTDYLKNVGLRIFPYFLCTTTIAVTIGLTIAMLIKPGNYIEADIVEVGTSSIEANVNAMDQSTVPDRIAALIPANFAEANVNQNMLQVVIFSIIIGVAIMTLSSERKRTLLSIADAIQDVALKVVSWAMLLAPLAVFGLLADITIRVGYEAIIGMSVYVGTVILGLMLLLVVYLLIVKLATNSSLSLFVKSVRDVQLLAFSTSSSAAVMPLSIKTAIEKLGVKPAISKFIVPLGATINMDGTALYQVVAALFLTQVYGVDLTSGEIVLLVVTTVGASIGSPSTPGVGIVILAAILQNIGIPPSGVALIIGVDRILDMCRTTINVTGDLTACVVMNNWLESSTLEESKV